MNENNFDKKEINRELFNYFDSFSEKEKQARKLQMEFYSAGRGAAMTDWIPVTERLPEEWQDVLVYGERRRPEVDYFRWYGEAFIPENEEDYYVTHWMPIPALPTTEEIACVRKELESRAAKK